MCAGSSASQPVHFLGLLDLDFTMWSTEKERMFYSPCLKQNLKLKCRKKNPMVTIFFEMTELFSCQKKHADFIKLSLAAPWAAWPAGSPLPCLILDALGTGAQLQAALPSCPAATGTHRLSPCDRYWEMLMFHSRANKMKCWQPGISQKTDVSFSGQLNLHTHIHTDTLAELLTAM